MSSEAVVAADVVAGTDDTTLEVDMDEIADDVSEVALVLAPPRLEKAEDDCVLLLWLSDWVSYDVGAAPAAMFVEPIEKISELQ